MHKDNSNNNKIKRFIWLGIAIVVIEICLAIFSSWILYKRTTSLLTDNLRERLLAISITAAASINAKDLEALQVEEDWKKPEWTRVVKNLHKAKYNNKDIVFMYIIRKDPNDSTKISFVADADSINPYAKDSEDKI
jgi:hypothetical protein